MSNNNNTTSTEIKEVQNVIPVPNSNQTVLQENRIIEPVQNDQSYASTNNQNLFDDNVFNSLRVNTGDTQLQQANVNTNNYTNNLVDMINQTMNQNEKNGM